MCRRQQQQQQHCCTAVQVCQQSSAIVQSDAAPRTRAASLWKIKLHDGCVRCANFPAKSIRSCTRVKLLLLLTPRARCQNLQQYEVSDHEGHKESVIAWVGQHSQTNKAQSGYHTWMTAGHDGLLYKHTEVRVHMMSTYSYAMVADGRVKSFPVSYLP